jgi:hypothetical protein
MKIAGAYDTALRRKSERVGEDPADENELAWQARWFSGCCGRKFTTGDGRSATILDFGEWNHEAGPDFVRATVRIGDDARSGAIEVDLDASGWETHQHATNADYENVVLHVVVRRAHRQHFSRTASHREVPQVCLADHPTTAAEWDAAAPARPGRCVSPLQKLPRDSLLELLAEAAQRRMERKALSLASMIEARGEDSALFESVAVALGYKHNKLPFRILAQRVPMEAARSKTGEALLYGLSGFLEQPPPSMAGARDDISRLWSLWWKNRAGCAAAVLPRSAWRMAGIRPANHPLRRLGAMAAIARQWKRVRPALEQADLPALQKLLGELAHPFWSFHTTWNSPRRNSPLALIGPDRIREIFANVALPFALATGRAPEWQDSPAGAMNSSLRIVGARLFGGSIPRGLARTLAVQQGLLQIYSDFCLNSYDECVQCTFPRLVESLSHASRPDDPHS